MWRGDKLEKQQTFYGGERLRTNSPLIYSSVLNFPPRQVNTRFKPDPAWQTMSQCLALNKPFHWLIICRVLSGMTSLFWFSCKLTHRKLWTVLWFCNDEKLGSFSSLTQGFLLKVHRGRLRKSPHVKQHISRFYLMFDRFRCGLSQLGQRTLEQNQFRWGYVVSFVSNLCSLVQNSLGTTGK